MISRKLDRGKFISYKGVEYNHDYYPDSDKYILYSKEDTACKEALHEVARSEIDALVSTHSWCIMDNILYEALSVEYDENQEVKKEYCVIRRLFEHLPNRIPMARVSVIWTEYCENGVTTSQVYYSKTRKDVEENVNCKYKYYLEEMSNGNSCISFVGKPEDVKSLHETLENIYGQRLVVEDGKSSGANEIEINFSIEYEGYTLSMDYWGVITLAPKESSGNGRMLIIVKYLQKNGLG